MNINLWLQGNKSYFTYLLRAVTSNTIAPVYPSSAFRSFSVQSLSELKGRDLHKAENYDTNDFHSLLWIAHDLKYNKTDLSSLCKDNNFFLANNSALTKIACNIAANRLGASLTCVHEKDFGSLLNFGKSLSSVVNTILLETTLKEKEIQKFADDSSVSVINIRSFDFAPVYVLAELLTLYEYYGYLRRITVGYIGPGNNPILNSYAIMLPKLGMHLRYFVRSSEMNSEAWNSGAKLASKFNTEFQQKDNWEDTIYRAHTISICPTNEENIQLTKKDTTEMEIKWSALHHQIDEAKCLSSDILNAKECLVWKSLVNLSWIFQALMVAKSTDFTPKSNRPDFEGEP